MALMNDHPHDVPWPLWASRLHTQVELAALLDVSARTLRRATIRGDVERVRVKGESSPMFRLKQTPWSVARVSAVGVRLSGADIDMSDRTPTGHVTQSEHSSGYERATGQPDTDRTPLQRVRSQPDTLTSMERQVEHLAEQVEGLRSELETARRDAREDAQRLEAEHAAMREQLAALIALLAVVVEAHRQRESTPPLHPIARLILSWWSWLKTWLDGWRAR